MHAAGHGAGVPLRRTGAAHHEPRGKHPCKLLQAPAAHQHAPAIIKHTQPRAAAKSTTKLTIERYRTGLCAQVAALSGIVVLIISLAINGRMMKRLHHLRTTQLGKTDERVKQVRSTLVQDKAGQGQPPSNDRPPNRRRLFAVCAPFWTTADHLLRFADGHPVLCTWLASTFWTRPMRQCSECGWSSCTPGRPRSKTESTRCGRWSCAGSSRQSGSWR